MRGPWTTLTALALVAAFTLGGHVGVLAQATPTAGGGGKVWELPGDAVYPEGVAYDEATGDFYVGSTGDGTIFRGNVEGGEVEVFSEAGADGRAVAVGMKVDAAGRLFVAGGPTGTVWVYDTATGGLLGQFSNGLTEGTFLNDVAIDILGNAYVTDSFNPALYIIPADTFAVEEPAGGEATPVVAASPTALSGELTTFLDLNGSAIEYIDGFNLNGIVTSQGANFLVVAQTGTGTLFFINAQSGAIEPIDVGGEQVNGDGMVLYRDKLYVVSSGAIVPIDLRYDLKVGEVGPAFTDPAFSSPTTIARYGNCLLVVNSQFAAREGGNPTLPFTVVSVPLPPLTDSATPAATGDC